MNRNAFVLWVLAPLIPAMAVMVQLPVVQPARAEQPVEIKYTRQALEEKWRARLQSFLDKGVIPLIDLQSSIKREDGESYVDDALTAMDALGVALIAFDGHQAPKEGKTKGYRWSYYVHEIVNAHPGHFILATNGGTSKNWTRQKGGRPRDYIDQLEGHVGKGDYAIMGELEFRHYMSNRQCKDDRFNRDVTVPLTSDNGHRVFRLSQKTGIAFVIHLEPEDGPLDELEAMLKAYPGAKVVVAHFGQIRHPEREKRFGPELVRRLLRTYPNLFYDLSTGYPNRTYRCNSDALDTVIWRQGGPSFNPQTDELEPEYKSILTEFSPRFVAGTDYGGGRQALPRHLREKVANLRLILRDLPDEAKHDIGYRNAWELLTGKDWTASAGTRAPKAKGPETKVAP